MSSSSSIADRLNSLELRLLKIETSLQFLSYSLGGVKRSLKTTRTKLSYVENNAIVKRSRRSQLI